jgi:hypothetical protein
MMIRAIAIYHINEENSKQPFGRTNQYVPLDAYKETTMSTLTFWQEPNYLLKYMEQASLAKLDLAELESVRDGKDGRKVREVRVVHFTHQNEHHCFRKVINKPYVMVICSKGKIGDEEAINLFRNIQYAVLQPASSGVTLAKIIDHPLDYTGKKDYLVESTLEQALDLKDEALVLIDKMLERGEKIEDLNLVTIELCLNTQRFQRESKQLNSYCSYC